VSIVTYAGEAGTALETTRVSDRRKILDVIDRLGAGGSTAGAAGIEAAYDLAADAFVEGGINRVILATDGDFNVGMSDPNALEDYIERRRESGIYLSVLGFGAGNYNDVLMQALAQSGNGNAAYIDTLNEARKVLVEEAGSTIVPIAGDVKIQVEFNPATVSEYRLIGYETRALAREDFNNDRVDAGDIGSGHAVTALYELTPVGSTARLIDDLRYQRSESRTAVTPGDDYAFLRLRYKLPGQSESRLIERAVTPADEHAQIADAGDDMRFAAAVAAFGQKLRETTYVGDFGYDEIAALAAGARGDDPFGYRNEFLTLVRLAGAVDRTAERR
jgi:Ca-activated chloride channel family protein